jgi:hypothetical protein
MHNHGKNGQISLKAATNMVICSAMQRYNEHLAHIFSWRWTRNSQELINSTNGVVLTPKVQSGPHQVMALSMGWICLLF